MKDISKLISHEIFNRRARCHYKTLGQGQNNMSEYVHKFYPEITCTVLSETNKGFKVLQNDPKHKKKPKVAYYSFLDFNHDKGVWIRK